MTEPAAPHGTTSTLPPPARITQLRQVIRYALGKEPHGWA